MKFLFTNVMAINSYTILIGLLVINYVSTSKYAKPTFVPYCTTKARCLSKCQCKVASDNCTLQEMTDQLRDLILFSHNQFRDILSNGEPTPSGLAILQYDRQLEEISRCWAVRCKNEKTECLVTPRFSETSQAVVTIEQTDYKARDSQSLWMNMMNSYLVPARYMSAEKVNTLPPDDSDLQQTAQVFSDRIFFVGCAWTEHIKENVKLWHFVCTYGPRGPVAGESIFSIGKPCSSCPEKHECNFSMPFTKLCKKVSEDVTTYGDPQESQDSSDENKPLDVPPPLLPPLQSRFEPPLLPLPPQPPRLDQLRGLSVGISSRVPGILRQIYPQHLTERSELKQNVFFAKENK